MTERGAAPSDVSGIEFRQSKQSVENPRGKNPKRIFQSLIIAGFSIGVATTIACGDSKSHGQDFTPTSESTVAVSATAVGTVQRTAEPVDRPDATAEALNAEIQAQINENRKIDGKFWWEAASDQQFTYMEIVEQIDYSGTTQYLRRLPKDRGVSVIMFDTQTHKKLGRAGTQEELFDLLFPVDPNSMSKSSGINESDGVKVMGYLLETNPDYITEFDGFKAEVDSSTHGELKIKILEHTCDSEMVSRFGFNVSTSATYESEFPIHQVSGPEIVGQTKESNPLCKLQDR